MINTLTLIFQAGSSSKDMASVNPSNAGKRRGRHVRHMHGTKAAHTKFAKMAQIEEDPRTTQEKTLISIVHHAQENERKRNKSEKSERNAKGK